MRDTAGGARRRNHAGFTLIELALVSLIVFILLNVSLPLFRNTFHSIRIEHAARRLSQTMWYLRERSVVEGRRYRLLIDFQGNSYRAEAEERERDGAAFFTPVKEEIGGRHRLDRAISLDGEEGEIGFYPDGRIDNALIRLSESSGPSWQVEVEGSIIRVFEMRGDEEQ